MSLKMMLLEEIIRSFADAVKYVEPTARVSIILSCECHSEPIFLSDSKENVTHSEATTYMREMCDKADKLKVNKLAEPTHAAPANKQ